MSAKDLLSKEMGMYKDDTVAGDSFDVGVRNKELRKNKIFSEILPNQRVLVNSPCVGVKQPTPEEKVRKWSLANIYRALRQRLRRKLDRREQVEGFDQIFYTGED